MKGPTRVILLRHVHTAANGDGDHVPMSGGQTDTGPSAVGEAQAAQLAERLGPELAGVPVYSSPLSRAIRTARAVASGQRVQVRPDLREIDCGELEGLVISEVKRRYRAEWDENQRHADPDFRWPGGESYREFRHRCLAAVRDVATAHAGGRVLLVTHTGFISQVVGSAAGMNAARWDLYRPGNASVTELLWWPGGAQLVRFDDRTHLGLRPPLEEALTAPATMRPHAG